MISKGVKVMDLAAGKVYSHFIAPVPYTQKFNFIGGLFDEFAIAYTCSTCGDYGIQDLGSKKYLNSIVLGKF